MHKVKPIKTESLAGENQILDERQVPIPVLLVEDDQIIQKIMALLLTNLNCQVEVANDARSAITMAKSRTYELIFLDIGLPDRLGDEVAAEIRRDEYCSNQATPIIAVTAHVAGERKEECLRAGINLVLTKPLSKRTAEQVIQHFVGDSK